MARIFISHSSLDNACASAIKSWLESIGFEAPFLDSDSETGIAPGAAWERTLYRELEGADAVILILTANWMASKWCFAEFTQARALGKPVFPIIEAPAGDRLVASDIQHLDLLIDRQGGLERLRRELERISSDIRRGYQFARGRAPYPGLPAFDENDAAVYFGRDDEILRLTELLRAQRAQGSGNVCVILGASGSGKSSLLRAGLLPRLKQEGSVWTTLPACRLKERPIDALALSMALALGEGADPTAWRNRLIEEPETALADLEMRLKVKAGASETQIVVPIDQFEELLTLARPGQAAAAWLLFNLMSKRTEAFVLVLTLRSDFLDRLQGAPDRGFDIVPFTLDPLPADCIPDIIQKPGRVVNIQIDDAFVQAAMRDAGSSYALPLLAFALREIYELRKQATRWTVEDYEALRDRDRGLNTIENAVRRAAELVMTQASVAGDTGLLRHLFIPRLVRVNEEDRYIKQPARRADLDPKVGVLIDKLITARLLSTWREKDEDLVEVAHEALFTKWPTLKQILDEDRDFLIGREQLRRDLEEWSAAGDDEKSSALLMGLKLQRARSWVAARHDQLTERERTFIAASIDADDARTRSEGRRRFVLVACALVIAAIIPVTAYWIDNERNVAQAERERAEAAYLASQSTTEISAGRAAMAAGLAARAVARYSSPDTRSALLQAVFATPDHLIGTQSTRGLSPLHLVWRRDSSAVIAAGVDGRLASWSRLEGPERRFAFLDFAGTYDQKGSRAGPVAISIDRQGQLIVVGSNGVITRGDPAGKGTPSPPLAGVDRIFAASVDDSGDTVAVIPVTGRQPALFDRNGKPLSLATAECEAKFPGSGFLSAVAIAPDATVLVLGFDDGRICSISLRDGQTHAFKRNEKDDSIAAVAVARSTRLIAARTAAGEILIGLPDLTKHVVIKAGESTGAMSWSPDGTSIVASCERTRICIWRIETADQALKEPTQTAQFNASELAPIALAWAPDGRSLISADPAGLLMLWTAERGDQTAFTRNIATDEALTGIAVSRDGTHVAIGTTSGTQTVWDPQADQLYFVPPPGDASERRRVVGVDWHPSKPWLATTTQGGHASVTRWPYRPGDQIRSLEHAGEFTALRWLRGGDAVAIGDADGQLTIWSPDAPEPNAVHEFVARDAIARSDIQALVLDAPRDRLITTGASGRVVAWSLKDLGAVATFEESTSSDAHANARSVLALSPDGRRLVAAGNDGQLLIYALATGRIEYRVNAGGRQIDDAAYSGDGSVLTTLRPDGRVDLWDLSDLEHRGPSLIAWFSLKTQPRAVSFLPHEKAFAIATAAGHLVIFSPDPNAWRLRAEAVAPKG